MDITFNSAYNTLTITAETACSGFDLGLLFQDILKNRTTPRIGAVIKRLDHGAIQLVFQLREDNKK